MNNVFFTWLFTTTLTWLIDPHTIASLVLLAISIPSIIAKFKKTARTKEDYINLAMELAKEITSKLDTAQFANTFKLNTAVDSIYKLLPADAEKYISKQQMIEIINAAYHTYVKQPKEEAK